MKATPADAHANGTRRLGGRGKEGGVVRGKLREKKTKNETPRVNTSETDKTEPTEQIHSTMHKNKKNWK